IGRLEIQDHFQPLGDFWASNGTATNSIPAKWNDIYSQVQTALGTSATANKWFINFTCATQSLCYPYTFAKGPTGYYGVYPINQQLHNFLSSLHAGTVGTIVMDFPERRDYNLPTDDTLIDDIIGLNWPFVTVSSPSVSYGGTATVTL